MMQGDSVPSLYSLIPPVGVRQRQSTNILTTDDPDVAQALRFIRAHACDPISVADVVRAVPLSRRVLEKRFLRQLNRTPHDEILNVRLGVVRQLLSETKLSLEAIALRAGFEHPEYLSVVFKRETGICPKDFRTQAPD
jgi:LacI family transcriptional regulator